MLLFDNLENFNVMEPSLSMFCVPVGVKSVRDKGQRRKGHHKTGGTYGSQQERHSQLKAPALDFK